MGDIAGVDTLILYNCKQNFIQEMAHLHVGGRKKLLIMDFYDAHKRYEARYLLKNNGNIAIEMPAHTSHFLQILEVSVFCPFKYKVQRLVHEAVCTWSVLDSFDVAQILSQAIATSYTWHCNSKGFCKSGVWNYEIGGSSVEHLKQHITKHDHASVT